MAIFKCKMCGGELTLVPSSTVCTCEYCGTKQTVPSADNEKKMTLFARANRILRNCEFDKAAGVFESIVADFPQEAEAYWGLVLCKYGIEYVDDPATGKRVPTCHRSSFESVMDDANYQQAVKNADAAAKEVYLAEGAQIEELRRDIIAVSSHEEPYDIFVCYKETDEKGKRTLDSVLAQDTYDALTKRGYRVFFSRITLESMLGTEYEPHIFAALNSAKVMLVFGTKPEHYEAVWVKNEWSRFLQLIAKGEKKTLIPCYKGMKPEDMPKEFARLQAQDMGKLGAMQDLLRGVEKILPLEKKISPESSENSAKDALDDLKNVVYTLIAKFKALPRKKKMPTVAFLIAIIVGIFSLILPKNGALPEMPIKTGAPSNAEEWNLTDEIVNIPFERDPGNDWYCLSIVEAERTFYDGDTINIQCANTDNLGNDPLEYLKRSKAVELLAINGQTYCNNVQSDEIILQNRNFAVFIWECKPTSSSVIGYFIGKPEFDGTNYYAPIKKCDYCVWNMDAGIAECFRD